jgi:hypothetical protein
LHDLWEKLDAKNAAASEQSVDRRFIVSTLIDAGCESSDGAQCSRRIEIII